MRDRINSSLSDNELAEALKLADYKGIVRQLNNFYGQGANDSRLEFFYGFLILL